ncbi:MAG: hypothetical protein IH991_01130, partial [Planctomycetes bacterium]|nr:hypothetical protein [Planctomycetota bacterium]
PFKDGFTWVLPNEDALLDLLVANDSDGKPKPPAIDALGKADQLAFVEIYETVYGDKDFDVEFTTEQMRKRWEKFLFDVSDYYDFGDAEMEGRLKSRRVVTKRRRDKFNEERIDLRTKVDELRAKASGEAELSDTDQEKLDSTVAKYDLAFKGFRREETRYKDEERRILQLRFQPLLADEIIDRWQERLALFIGESQAALDEYFKARTRFRSYEEDLAQVEWRVVAGRKTQLARIERELRGTRAPLQAQLVAIEKGLVQDLNALAVADQAFTETARKDPLPMGRPDLETPALKTINAVLPWFDTIVGALLILGLFTRPAAFAGAAFLFSIMIMSPPWLSTSELTYYQAIELFALLVLIVVGAGRFAGLDLFVRCLAFKCCGTRRVASEPANVIQAQVIESTPVSNAEISHESNS